MIKKNYHHGDLATVLLEAAEKELSESGIEAFSLRAVAKRACVSHGAPAHHFKDIKGLLTALAAIGYKRFVHSQHCYQNKAQSDPQSQLVAAGLGYIDFAVKNPALFRLMFSSEKPDRDNARFSAAANAAFDKLVDDSRSFYGVDPYKDRTAMKNVMALWAMVHGLADLMIAGRLERPMGFSTMTRAERDSELAQIILRTIV